MAELNIRERQTGDVAILDLQGKITIGETSPPVRSAISNLINAGKKKILLNFGSTVAIDASGASEVIVGHAAAAGGNLKLVNVPDNVQQMLKAARSASMPEIYAGEDEALRSFKG